MTLGHIQFVGIRKLLNILIPHKLPPQNVCSAIRCYHANEGMMGINKNDLKLYKTAYRDHPLRRRVDIQDDLHLWSMSNLQKSIINAEDIPLLSDIPFPPPFKSEIGNTKIRFPYPSKSIRSSLHPDDWMLTRVALHLGNISEVEADAIVVGTDSSMTKYQQTSQHLYTNPSLSIAESMGGISNGLSRFSKARDVPSMDDAAHTSMMRTKKGSKRTFPVGTVTQITNMNCNARATLLTVQPVIVDEKQYKLCVKNILDEMKRRQYRTLLLPILRLQGMRVTPYSGTRWTLEAISDWLAQENDELRMDVGYGKHNDAQSMDQPIQMDDDDDANDEIENQLLKERIENRTAEVGRMESKNCRIIVVVETERQWKLLHELTKLVLRKDRSPLVNPRPHRVKLRYTPGKSYETVHRIPTGEEALRIIRSKERQRRARIGKRVEKIKENISQEDTRLGSMYETILVHQYKDKREKTVLNGGGRNRGCGDYEPLY